MFFLPAQTTKDKRRKFLFYPLLFSDICQVKICLIQIPDPMNTVTALVLFLLGAVGGLIMAIRSIREQPIPWILAIGHGLLVASGLIVLLINVLNDSGGTLATVALIVLATAALGGFYLLRFHISKEKHPQGVIIIHALAAVIGVGLLIGDIVSR